MSARILVGLGVDTTTLHRVMFPVFTVYWRYSSTTSKVMVIGVEGRICRHCVAFLVPVTRPLWKTLICWLDVQYKYQRVPSLFTLLVAGRLAFGGLLFLES